VCGTGSTGRIACDIKNMLEKNQNKCKIAYGRDFYDDPDCIKIESDLVFKAHVFFSRITDRQGFYSTAATKRLVRSIEHFNPDIIHLHNIHGYYLDIRVLFEFLKEYNKPVVWTLHDCWAFTGHCAYFSFANCDKWKTGCGQCPQKSAYPASYVLDDSKKSYSEKKRLFTGVKNLNIVTPSHWLADVVKESFFKDFQVRTIYNGLDLDVFRFTDSDFKEKNNLLGKKMVLGVANIWEKRKGLDDFIELSKILPDDYKIVLVGLSEKQIDSLPKNIIGISRTENITKLVEIYSAADVYVNASVEETMGLTTVEALATGTPAVVYNATAVPEVVDEKSGVIVAPGDINALANAIINMNLKPEDCIERAKMFEKNQQYEIYLKLYEEIFKK
jgi:glycosyltransferase involved in cell wall biosynthesis